MTEVFKSKQIRAHCNLQFLACLLLKSHNFQFHFIIVRPVSDAIVYQKVIKSH